MALSFSLLVAIFGVFVSQNAIEALQLQLPYDPTIYRSILSGAPYYSFCDLPWLSFFEPSYFAKFNDIANDYNIRPSDVYQFHAIIDSNMPNLPYPNEYNILSTTAAELKKEMDRRGIYYLPTPPACFKADKYSAYPTTNPPDLFKRAIIPDPYDSYPDPYPLPTYTSPNIYPLPTYPSPNPYDPYDLTPSSYDLSLAYKNLYVMLDQQMPILPSSTYNNILNSVIQNTPPQYQNEIDDVTTQLTTNLRYVLGMAQQRIPPLY